jgi:integrase
MAKNKDPYLVLRNETWHLRMRVPSRYRTVEKRKVIKQSLHTDSKTEAKTLAAALRRDLLADLDNRLLGEQARVNGAFDNIVALARARGTTYRTASELADGSLSDLMGRFNRLMKEDPTANQVELVSAELGGVERPATKISDLVAEYEKGSRSRLAGKTDDQLRRWRNPYSRAVKELLKVVPDKPAAEITRQDALALEAVYLDRVAEGEILADTANKSLGFLRTLLRAHCKRHQLDDNMAFSELTISGGRPSKKRREFSVEWLSNTLLCANPLPGTNAEIRDVLVIMAETGAGPSEITGALPHHFRVHDDIPHIQIKEDGRKLKNEFRVRDLVLVGPALEAARRHPEGFPRYRNKPGFSDAANAFLRENGLLPTAEHTVYSIRHSFQGRLRRAGGIDQFFQARMMGHSAKKAMNRESYGDDLTLEQRLALMNVIRLDVSEDERRRARQVLLNDFMAT